MGRANEGKRQISLIIEQIHRNPTVRLLDECSDVRIVRRIFRASFEKLKEFINSHTGLLECLHPGTYLLNHKSFSPTRDGACALSGEDDGEVCEEVTHAGGDSEAALGVRTLSALAQLIQFDDPRMVVW